MEIFKQINSIVSKSSLQEVKGFCDIYDEIEVDTETTGLDPHLDEILCVQLGTAEEQYLLEWNPSLIPWLDTLFNTKGKIFIFQNAKFDLQFFYKHGIYFPNNIYDTFLAESVIYCGMDYMRKSLDALAKRYLNVDISKEIRSQINELGLTKEVIEYGLNDVKYLTRIKEKQVKILNAKNLEKALRLDNSFVRVLAYIEFSGIGFDNEKWLKKAELDLKELNEIEARLNAEVISHGDIRFIAYGDLFSQEEHVCTVNWRSEKQVEPLLESLGVNTLVVEKGETKKSIGFPVIGPQTDKHIIVELYVKFSKYAKRVSTFGEDYLQFVHPTTGRIHTVYKQILNTGRMSCGNKKSKKPNLQQVPGDIEHRGCFVASEGNVLINADYSGQESVIFANKCLDPSLLAFYDEGLGDMHSYVAKLCFSELDGIALEDVKEKRKDLRQKAKSAGFAIAYGGNGFTLATNLGISQEEGDEIYTSYMSAFSGIKEYFEKVSRDVYDKGHVVFNHVTGRKSYVDYHKEFKRLDRDMKEMDWSEYRREKLAESPKFKNTLQPKVKRFFSLKGTMERRSYNYPTQGTAADITKTASILIFNELLQKGLLEVVRFVHIVHDEIILECPESMAEDISRLVKEGMEKAGEIFYTRVKLHATPVISNIWEH